MQRQQFQELVARAAAICAREELIIFGSQSVHAVTENPPVEVLLSVESSEQIHHRIQTFPDPHTQAVLLARLRIATESTDTRV